MVEQFVQDREPGEEVNDIFRSGGQTIGWNRGRSTVSKKSGNWVASHPMLGTRYFHTFPEAMDYASVRFSMMNPIHALSDHMFRPL